MSLWRKTPQPIVRLGIASAEKARSAISSRGIPNLSATPWRKAPFPEEHWEFSLKSTTAPFLKIIIFTSTPPTSHMQSASGKKWSPAVAWATVSTMATSAPIMSLKRSFPYPVTPTARTLASPILSFIFLNMYLASSMGLPLLRVYTEKRTSLSLDRQTAFAVVDPKSQPMTTSSIFPS